VKLLRVLAVPAALTLVAACGGGGTPSAHQAKATTASAPATKDAHPVSQTTARPPAMAGVTTRGALVLLSPATGAPVRTLVPNGVIGDEISVSSDGQTIFFQQAARLRGRRGGGSRCPAASRRCSRRGAFPRCPRTEHARVRPAADPDPALPEGGGQRPLRPVQPGHQDAEHGVERVYPMLPAGQSGGLPAPISHLSWAANGTELAVSIAAIQDNEGWQIMLVDNRDRPGLPGRAGDTQVPVTGLDRRRSYWREGVYLPGGNLFVSGRAAPGNRSGTCPS